MHLAVTWQHPNCFEKAKQLAHTLELPLISDIQGYDYALQVTNTHLELISHPKYQFTPLWIDFTNPSLQYRLTQKRSQQEILKKALGIKKDSHPLVLDATAGMGTDALILAHLGCNVHLVERSPLIAELLADGLQRAQQSLLLSSLISRMQLSKKDAKEVLLSLSPHHYPDITYLDPLFPKQTKSALHKKAMQLLHAITEEEDVEALFFLALQRTKQRIIVKRPLRAENLGKLLPHHVIQAKQIRYDIYFPKS